MSNKVPRIRFNGYSDSWVQRNLGDLAEIVRGASPRPIQDPKWFDESSEIGWLRISDVTEQNGRIHHLEQHISEAGQAKTRVLTEPHLLLSIAATVGKPLVNYVKTGVHDGFLIFMNPKFDLEFMFQWLESYRDKWSRYGQPGSQVNLNSDLVKNQSISIPSMDEQQKLGEFFTSIDNLIAANQRKLDFLKEQKKGYLQKMFPKNGAKVPELRFAGFADDWEERKLSNYITITGGNAWKSSDYSIGGDYLVVTIANVQGQRNINDKIGNKISVADPGKYLLKREDILVSLTGNVGRVSRMTDIPAVLNQRVGLVKPKTKKIDDEFLFQVLSNRRFESSMVASGQGAAQANISNNDVLSYELLVPQDVREQSIIAHFFRNFDNAIALHQRKLDLLKEQKKGFLQKMFV